MSAYGGSVDWVAVSLLPEAKQIMFMMLPCGMTPHHMTEVDSVILIFVQISLTVKASHYLH